MKGMLKRSMVVENRRCARCCFALLLCAAIGSVFVMPSDAAAGGVYLGFGVDVPLPGRVVAPPADVYPPPFVAERVRPAPPVMVEQAPPPLVVHQAPPAVVYEGPVVVERRSTVYYYPSSYPRTYHEETEREYYRQRSRTWEDGDRY